MICAGLATLVAAVVLAFDLYIELGVASSVAYVAVVWIASLTNKLSLVWAAVALSIAFTAIGYEVSPLGGNPGR